MSVCKYTVHVCFECQFNNGGELRDVSALEETDLPQLLQLNYLIVVFKKDTILFLCFFSTIHWRLVGPKLFIKKYIQDLGFSFFKISILVGGWTWSDLDQNSLSQFWVKRNSHPVTKCLLYIIQFQKIQITINVKLQS